MGYLLPEDYTSVEKDIPSGNGTCSCICKRTKTEDIYFAQREFFMGRWVVKHEDEDIVAWAFLPQNVKDVVHKMNGNDNTVRS